MRVTYRQQGIQAYWQERWERVPVDNPVSNLDTYPIKYAEMTVRSGSGRILEAGCGNGRVLRFYKDKGFDIAGVDFAETALRKLKEADPQLNLQLADIRDLPFQAEVFQWVLAFGIYHNFDVHGLRKALRETFRVLKAGGQLCASYRSDNLHNWLIDKLAERKGSGSAMETLRHFHKMNLNRNELLGFFREAGFFIDEVYPVENMPLLYKFGVFRAAGHKTFNESLGRREGYRLSVLGRSLQRLGSALHPDQFCNVFVVIARKP